MYIETSSPPLPPACWYSMLFTGQLLLFIQVVVKFHGHSMKMVDDEPLFCLKIKDTCSY